MDLHYATIGIIAGVIEGIAFVPYIVAILRGKTRPHRGSWFIWTLLGLVVVLSYGSAGAEATLWVPLAMFVGMLCISVLSLKYGVGGWEDSLDRYCLIGALIGLLCLLIFTSPLIALSVAIITDVFAAVPTVRKSIYDPESEDVLAWSLAFLANVLNLIAIEEWTIGIAGYPVYASIVFGAICFPLLRYAYLKRRHKYKPLS